MHTCAKKNYKYAGLQDGGMCYCGNKFGSYGAANESACPSNCYGYARQNCGGLSSNAVYQTQMGMNRNLTDLTFKYFLTFTYKINLIFHNTS